MGKNKIRLDKFVYGEETELSKEEIEKRLFDYNKLGWTDSSEVFIKFINCAIQVNKEVETICESFYIYLSEAARKLFNEQLEVIMLGYIKTPNKIDYLKFHLKNYYINPDLLTTHERRNQGNNLKILGYTHGLSQIDFCLNDFFNHKENCKPPSQSLLGIEYYSTEKIHNNSFPISINIFLLNFSPYFINFQRISEGYSQFLMATEIQKMLNDLENNKTDDLSEAENLKKLEIDNKVEKNELITKGYKPPTEKTILTVAQTALLIDYLQDNQLLVSKHLGFSKTAKIFEILTKYSNNTLRPNLSKTKIAEIKNQSSNGSKETFGNLKKLKEVLQNIVLFIDKEIEEKELMR